MLRSPSSRVAAAFFLLCALPSCPAVDPGEICDAACRASAVPDHCVGTEQYFAEYSWPLVFSTCVECHVAGGESDGTRFVLKDEGIPDHLRLNQDIVREAGHLEQGSIPLLLLKSTARIEHGGGRQIEEGSVEAATILETLARLEEPVICPGEEAPDPFEGVALHDAYGTLRKASLQLVGRPPSAGEISLIDAEGLGGIDPLLDAMMDEPAFDERVREIFGDVLLTDGFRANHSAGTSYRILDGANQPDGVNHWGGPDWNYRSWERGEGIRLVEALAREPLHFFVHAFRENAPLSTVLTARHRYVDAYSARFFGVSYKGYPPGTPFEQIPSPQEYEGAAVPLVNEEADSGEYAGVLTTTAFRLRYPSSPTNFNRKIARFTYKYFLDYDIMKSAPRIDASAVDLDAMPTRHNEQCTGCHTQIDPVAGAFKNWDECGWSAQAYYRLPGDAIDPRGERKSTVCNTENGWVDPADMFDPGLGPDSPLSVEQGPQAVEHLADWIVGQRSFARSMVTHLWTGLMGRGLSIAPSDPSIPGYAERDAAFNLEQQEINRLTDLLVEEGLRPRRIVREIVRSPFFRAKGAEEPGRLDLLAVGGGALVNPEILDRKVQAITGVRWRKHGWARPRDTGYQSLGRHDGSTDAFLLHREEMKTLYGGLDGTFDGVKVRQRTPSTLTAAIAEVMALAVSCEATARDLGLPSADRLLFPGVDVLQVPTGEPTDASEAPILAAMTHLHERVLGERLAPDSEEILASYALLHESTALVAADIDAGLAPVDLPRPCSADLDLSAVEPTAGGIRSDPDGLVRGWQTVLASLLLDPTFLFER